MITRRFLMAFAAALAFAVPAFADGKLKVVGTFSILTDFVANVGGDRVEVISLVGPDGDAHVYQPSPADAQAVAGAAVIVVNGLGFEGWMDRLVEASGTKATLVTASDGVTPIAFGTPEHGEDHAEEEGHDHDHDQAKEEKGHVRYDHGTFDPHAWQSGRTDKSRSRRRGGLYRKRDSLSGRTWRFGYRDPGGTCRPAARSPDHRDLA